MSKIAFNDMMRKFFSIRPKDVYGQNNTSVLYFKAWCWRKIYSMFDIEGFPEVWDWDYFVEHLYKDGVIAVTDTRLGVIPLKCGFTGVNVWEHPTSVIIANPVLGNLTRNIDKNCVLLHLNPDYSGLSRMVDRYAYLLANCDSSISVNLMNTRVPFIIEAPDRATAQTYKVMYDKISEGEPCVAVRTTAGNETKTYFQNVKQCYIAQDIQILKQSIKREFLTEIGVASVNTEKTENLIKDEVNSTDDERAANLGIWYNNLSKGIEQCNQMYGYSMRIRVRQGTELANILKTDSMDAESEVVDDDAQ